MLCCVVLCCVVLCCVVLCCVVLCCLLIIWNQRHSIIEISIALLDSWVIADILHHVIHGSRYTTSHDLSSVSLGDVITLPSPGISQG